MPPVVSPTPEEARATRRAKLFARWSQGGRLSKEEEAEIADLVAQAKGEPVLALEATPAAVPGTYKQSYRWYAETLDFWPEGTSIDSRVRTIKRWVQAGRTHQPRADFPPLDEPTQLAAWMGRVMQRDLRKWDKLRAMGTPPPVPGEVVPAKNSATTQPPKSVPPPAPPPTTFDLAQAPAFSAVDNLDKFRRLTGAAYQLYADALLKGTPDVDQRHRAYLAASAELRKNEKDTEELREARGELIPQDRLVDELRRVHTAMAGSLRAILADHDVPPDTSAKIITAFFRPLRAATLGLAGAIPPEAAPPATAAA